MRKILVLLVLFVAGLGLSAPEAFAEHTRVTNPNVIGGELLGRGILYSVFFDRALNDDLAAGIGFGGVSAGAVTAQLIPAYVNYYFAREAGSIFATAGATVSLNSSSLTGTGSSVGSFSFGTSAVIPTFGVGYESRGDSGFLFRLTGYGMIADKFSGWVGFSFGFAF